MQGEIERRVVLPVSGDELWEAITDSDQLSEWFGADVDLDPRPGGDATFVGEDGEVRRARVEEVDHGRRLAFRWWPEDEGDVAATRVELVVEEVGEDASMLTVVETGLVTASAWLGMGSGASWADRLPRIECRGRVAVAA